MYGFYWATLYVFGEKKMYIILSCLGPGGHVPQVPQWHDASGGAL